MIAASFGAANYLIQDHPKGDLFFRMTGRCVKLRQSTPKFQSRILLQGRQILFVSPLHRFTEECNRPHGRLPWRSQLSILESSCFQGAIIWGALAL